MKQSNGQSPQQQAGDLDLDQLLDEATGRHPAPDLAERIAARHRDAVATAAPTMEVEQVNDGFNNWWIAAAVALGMAALGGVAWERIAGDGRGGDRVEDRTVRDTDRVDEKDPVDENRPVDETGPIQNPNLFPLYTPPKGIAHVHSGAEVDALPADTKALHCFDFTDGDMASLARLTELEWLDLSGMVEESTWNLNSPPLTDQGLVHLAGLRNLKVLILDECGNVLGEGLEHVGRLTGLLRLSLSRCNIDRAHLMQLAPLTELRSLHLNGNDCAEADSFRFILGLRKLQFLNLGLCFQLRADFLRSLGTLRTLRSLDLSYVCGYFLGQTAMVGNDPGPPPRPVMQKGDGKGVTDEVLAGFAQLDRLEALTLYWCPEVTDDGLRHLMELPKLRELDIRRLPKLTDGVGATLPRSLELIRCGECRQLGDKFLEELGQRCPDLKTLDLARVETPMARVKNRFTQAGLAVLLAGVTQLEHLNLKGNTQMVRTSDDDWVRVQLSGLKTLILDANNTAVEWWLREPLLPFRNRTVGPVIRLEGVSLYGTKVTDEQLVHLATAPLKGLDVRRCGKITGVSIEPLRRLPLQRIAFEGGGWSFLSGWINEQQLWPGVETDEGQGHTWWAVKR